ncbi:maltose ABC transporter permease MalF [Natronospora cellulosivora (SeqCode)]
MNFWQKNKAHIFKLIFLAFFNALALLSLIISISQGGYILAVITVFIMIIINFVYLSDRFYPLRYILPGTFFMILLVVYPIFYTIYISTTNYGTGNMLNKDQVINHLENRTYLPDEPRTFNFTAFKNEEIDQFKIIFEDREREEYYMADTINREISQISLSDAIFQGLSSPSELEEINGYKRLDRMQIIQNLGTLEALKIEFADNELRMEGINTFALYRQRFVYNSANDTIIDQRDAHEYVVRQGHFYNEEMGRLSPGFRTFVGFRNYRRLLTDDRILQPFFRVFVWTFIWALLSVATTFALGLLLALVLNDKDLRFRKLYRTILIIPYAMPGFISILIWRGLFNPEVGVINRILEALPFVDALPFMNNIFWTRAALVLVNLWLGFPYMMLITLGALQSINPSLYEVSAIDGASIWQRFRYITLPLLFISVGPLLVSSFAYNFNNFNLIYLFNAGRPAIAGAQTPAGGTDILITYTYRLSFETGRGADFGLASAVTLMIFIIVATITWFNFRFTGALEEVKENE